MGTKRPSTYKQLAFETAIRNPERYIDILTVLKKYDGWNLNKENLLTIVCDLYKNKIVKTFSIKDFVTTILNKTSLIEIEKYTEKILDDARNRFAKSN